MRFVGRLVWRVVKLVVTLLVLAIAVVMVMGAITTQRGWPQTTGTITVAGLHQSVTVARDRYGIIQITAEDRHDLFLAQGYVHAQERMWQMEVSRRIGAGRLSELFGKGQVDRDTYIRTLGWRVAAERDLAAMSPDSIAILEAYADGVNAWIADQHGELSTPFVLAGVLSGSGQLGGIALEPWTPLDTATWQKVQAWSLGGNVDTEIFRLLADARLLDPAKTDELFPAYDAGAPVITPTGLSGSGGAGAPATPPVPDETTARSPIDLAPAHATALADLARLGTSISGLAGLDGGDGMVGGHGVGSNDWVVSGGRTVSGKPLLANDPHLGFSMPSVWIMNGLHCRNVSDDCPWDVVGVTFPGAPAVVLGHNARIAWGATNVGPDTQDLFLETADPSDPDNRYLYQGASVAYEIRHETIKVGGGADVPLDVRSTRHGVVLSDVDSRLKDGPILSLRWATTAAVDLTLESFFRIDTATDFESFRAAFEDYGSPSQNFVYADVDGHVGYVLPGLIPIRAGDPTGDRVRDGKAGQEWTGYVARADLPWQLDPVGGQIVSANNAPVDAQYPHWLGSDWDPGYRAARIGQLLGNIPGKLTAEDMRSIQLDTHVLRADKIMPRLEQLGPVTTTDDGRLLWARMVDWNRECDVNSLGCAAYMSVEVALQRAIFDDELGPIARDYVGSTFAWEALAGVLGRPSDPWWTDTTPGVPTGAVDAPSLAGAAIDRTAAELRKAYGDPENWTWGRLHQVTFRESTLGSSGILPLELFFNAPGLPVAGADGAIDNNYSRISLAYPDPDEPGSAGVGIEKLFEVSNGPSYRFTIDMGDLDGAQIVITTGQSGNPLDAHYGDMIPIWAEGQTVPLPFSGGNIVANTTQTLTLQAP